MIRDDELENALFAPNGVFEPVEAHLPVDLEP
jgi:hypothetical protein